jgi:midasin (ATPase involved in ribosome maturation)
MRYLCTRNTDLDDLIGAEATPAQAPGFKYGPIPLAMRADEELVLENSDKLPAILVAKVRLLVRDLFIAETEEHIRPGAGFRLVLG